MNDEITIAVGLPSSGASLRWRSKMGGEGMVGQAPAEQLMGLQ